MPNNAVKHAPINYGYGNTFNYAVWTENTVLTLTNVNWNNDYRDVVRFNSKADLDTYIDNKSDKLTIDNMTLAKFNRNVRVNAPINSAMKYNYLRAENPPMPVEGDTQRTYYYFILGVEYVNPNTTELMLQLDVWQTFGYDVTFGNCFIERGHIGIANENAFDNYGRDYLSIPEGLDVGGEYRIVKTARETVMDISGADAYSVLVCSTVDLTKNPGTPKSPKLVTAPGSVVDGIASGASFYIFPTPGDFVTFMQEFSSVPWVTEGIISATCIPNIRRYFPSATLTDVSADIIVGQATLPDGSTISVTLNDVVMYKYPTGPSGTVTTPLAPNWRDTFLNFLPAKYQGLKKLLTYPYSVIELTTWAGQPLAIRPEAWADDDATIKEIAVMMPPAQRIAFMPYRYNGDPNTSAVSDDDNAEYLDFATTMSGFPSVPVVNNMYLSYLASNKNGLAFAFSSADWSQQRALRGAQATGDVANTNIRNMARQGGIGNTAAATVGALNANTMATNAMTSGAAGAVSAMATGAAGAGELAAGQAGQGGAGIFNGLRNAQNMLDTTNVGINATGASAVSSIQATSEVRDTNVSLAQFSARGDYQNAIAGINAKIQDARLNQPSTSGQFGGDALNLAHSNAEVSARFKLIDGSTLKRIGNFWLRYGYAIDQFAQIPDDFMCMSKFTYWKLSETYITSGNIPEMFKQAIRGIFEKGVTVWADPGYIGTTALSDNDPKTGITY